ncbi:hypothetical protein [Lactovum odontotermitis]
MNYNLPLTYRYNFVPVVLFGTGGIVAGAALLIAVFYGVFQTHAFTVFSFVFILAAFFAFAMAFIYIYDALPYMKNRAYLIVSEEGLTFPKKTGDVQIKWTEMTGFEEVKKRSKKLNAIQVELRNPIPRRPVLIVGENIVGELPKILEILRSELAKQDLFKK